jgi:hypothetical protein
MLKVKICIFPAEWRVGHQPGGHRREGRRRGAKPAPLHPVSLAQRPRGPERAAPQRRRTSRGQRPEIAGALSHGRRSHLEGLADECPAGVRQVDADGGTDRHGNSLTFWFNSSNHF